MKCFIGIEKKLEDNTLFCREPVQIDKDWSNMFRFFCSRNKSGGRLSFVVFEVSVFQKRASHKTNHCSNPV